MHFQSGDQASIQLQEPQYKKLILSQIKQLKITTIEKPLLNKQMQTEPYDF